MGDWVQDTFIAESASLPNPDHAHLRSADIAFLWTNVPNQRRGRGIAATCQIMPPNGEPWGAGRATFQIMEWFGQMPDFLITIFAPLAAKMDDASFLALVEHELYHAAQDRDQYGNPKFSKITGKPTYTMRGHDVEEFVGVVERYGADASDVRALVSAANRGPTVAQASIANACGTCLRLVK
jgi:hypothetical protein